MKNVVNDNVHDDTLCCALLEGARKGDKTKQKRLYTALANSVEGVMYNYYYTARNVGLSIYDLRSLSTQAFMKVFEKHEAGLCSVSSYYRYIYANLIKNAIRDALLKTNVLNRNVHDIMKNLDDDDDVLEMLNASEDKKIKPNGNELTRIIVEDNRANLNQEEHLVLCAYLDDFNVHEIAEKYCYKYRTVRILLEKAKEKTKSYIKNNLKDLYTLYSGN